MAETRPEGIAPGGCLPDRDRDPDRDREPEPDSLDADVDWMTYPHQRLWDMVHSGMALDAAGEVARGWHRLGTELDDIGAELRELLAASADAWEGEAAETARASIASLTDWTTRTSHRAGEVAGCLALQVEYAQQARSEMPEPLLNPIPATPAPMTPGPEAHGAAGPDAAVGATVPSGAAAGAFSSRRFGDAGTMNTDFVQRMEREQAAHREAAEVMRKFQVNSRQVHGEVPRFTDPASPVYGPLSDKDRERDRDRGPDPGPRGGTGTGDTRAGGTGATVAAATGQGGVTGLGGATGLGGGTGPGGQAGGPSAAAGAGGTIGAGPVDRAAGGQFAIGGPAAGAGGTGATGAAAARPGAAGPAGAMIPPGAAGGAGNADRDRSSASILEEDDELFGTPPVPPSVIGEDPPDAR